MMSFVIVIVICHQCHFFIIFSIILIIKMSKKNVKLVNARSLELRTLNCAVDFWKLSKIFFFEGCFKNLFFAVISSAVVFSQKCPIEGSFGNFFHWYLCRNRYKVCDEYENVMKSTHKKKTLNRREPNGLYERYYSKHRILKPLLVCQWKLTWFGASLIWNL